MQHIVILDYSTSTVLFFVESNTELINEEWIKSKNLNPDECSWMISNNEIHIEFHNHYDL